MAAVVLHGGDTPEHEGELDEGKAGREVELVQEQFWQEDHGEHQPVPEQGAAAAWPRAQCAGVLESLVSWEDQAHQDLRDIQNFSHNTIYTQYL